MKHLPTSRCIDTHQHVFWHSRDDRALIADMDAEQVEYAWLLTWEIAPEENRPEYTPVLNPGKLRHDGTHPGILLEDLVIARDRYPDRFILGFCPHPLMGDAVARLKAAHGMFGAKVCGEWKFRIPFDDPRCIRLFRAAGELKMPVVLHLDVPFLANPNGAPTYYEYWYGGTVDNLERALQACPETIFIGHAPGFWREICKNAGQTPELYPTGKIEAPGRAQQLLERYPNLYADLSASSALRALKRDPEYARELLTTFADRLLFARDYYGGDLNAFLRELALPTEVFEKIYFRNAEKLVPPPAPAH